MTRTLLGITLLAVATLAACGGDDTSGGSSASSASATASGTSSSAGGSASSASAGGAGQGGGGGSASSAVASSSSGGSACNGNVCDVTVNGSGFADYEGQTVHIGFVAQGGKNFDYEDQGPITNGAFTFMGTGVLTKGKAYFLNYYVDVNGDGMCEATPTDHVWRQDVPSVQANVTITLVHDDMTWSNIGCGGF